MSHSIKKEGIHYILKNGMQLLKNISILVLYVDIRVIVWL